MRLFSTQSFIVPVAFVTTSELELNVTNNPYLSYDNYTISERKFENTFEYIEIPVLDPRLDFSSEEIQVIKHKIKKYIEYKFYQLKDMSSMLMPEQLLLAHINIYKTIFNIHTNTSTCLSDLKTKPLNGKTYEQVLDMHLNKFKETYILHKNMLNCSTNNELKSSIITNEQLMTKSKHDETELTSLLNSILINTKKLTHQQLLEIHEMICETLINLHVNNSKCFNDIKSNGINGMTFEQIITMHLNKVKETFSIHVNILQCQ